MGSEVKTSMGMKFFMGGSAGMAATCVVQPLDLLKNRMQLMSTARAGSGAPSSMAVALGIVKSEGITAFYTGLSAGLFRQATYTTTRLGVYNILLDRFTEDGKPPNFAAKALIGMTAGAVGAFVGTPAEVSLIRMTSDGRLPVEQRRGYKNVFNALARISREEGVTTLWSGCLPTMGRAMVVNAAQLATYTQAKQLFLSTGYFNEGTPLHFAASMVSGFAATLASMPTDIAKTRIQNMRTVNGVPEYKGVLDVWMNIARKEGVLSLWKGFFPYYFRLGPHTVLTFIFLEKMNEFIKKGN
eukprot:Nk52_evm26s207 gene=Nk52_evmTU26s207